MGGRNGGAAIGAFRKPRHLKRAGEAWPQQETLARIRALKYRTGTDEFGAWVEVPDPDERSGFMRHYVPVPTRGATAPRAAMSGAALIRRFLRTFDPRRKQSTVTAYLDVARYAEVLKWTIILAAHRKRPVKGTDFLREAIDHYLNWLKAQPDDVVLPPPETSVDLGMHTLRDQPATFRDVRRIAKGAYDRPPRSQKGGNTYDEAMRGRSLEAESA